MKRRGGVVLALATIVAAALASTAGSRLVERRRTQAINCKSTVKIAVLTPLHRSGRVPRSGSGLVGATLAGKNLGDEARPQDQDRPGRRRLDARPRGCGRRRTEGHRRHARSLGVVGLRRRVPRRRASHGVLRREACGSSPARRRRVADEERRRQAEAATAAFFRVVAGRQRPGHRRDAHYMVTKLQAPRRSPSSTSRSPTPRVSPTRSRRPEGEGRQRSPAVLGHEQHDRLLARIVNRIAKDTDVVFTPFQLASNAQAVGGQLREQGKKAIVFGTDGTIVPAFKFAGLVRLQLRSGPERIPSKKALVDQWKKANPGRRSRPSARPPTARRRCSGGDQEGVCRREGHDHAGRTCSAAIKTVQDQGLDPRAARSPGRRRRTTRCNGSFWLFQIQSDGTPQQHRQDRLARGRRDSSAAPAHAGAPTSVFPRGTTR